MKTDLFKKPLFWIILFGLIRLIGITNPPLETGHNWRQVTGLMVSRNFLEVDNDIRLPRSDQTEGTSGIMGMEFPIMNYIYYWLAILFGYEHWYGRIINLIISSLGIYYFSKMAQFYFIKRTALYATIALLSSIWFAYSRKMMPDTFSIGLIMIALYHGLKFLRQGNLKSLVLYFLFCTLGILAKIPAIIYLPILVLPYFRSTLNWKKKIVFLALSSVAVLLMFYWYFLWIPYLAATYGNWANLGMGFKEGAAELMNNWPAVAKNFYFHSFYSFTAFLLYVAGFIVAIIKKERLLLYCILSVGLLGMPYIIKSGFFFHHHNYYIIPFVPLLAIMVGYALDRLKLKAIAIALISLVVVEGIANQQHDFFITNRNQYKATLETITAKYVPKGEKVVINSKDNPQQLYLSHRKGWLSDTQQLESTAFQTKLKADNTLYIIIDKHISNPVIEAELLFENEDYKILKFVE